MADIESIEGYLSSLGIEYSAWFIPFSKSRFYKSDIKSLHNYSINWGVSLKKGRQVITTDYSQGIGNLPEHLTYYNQKVGTNLACAIIKACEEGRALVDINKPHGRSYPLEVPRLRDVVHSLVMDCSVIDYDGFEEWAIDFGYNPDSIKDNKVYKDCWQTALKMQAMLGNEVIRKLEELYQDY